MTTAALPTPAAMPPVSPLPAASYGAPHLPAAGTTRDCGCGSSSADDTCPECQCVGSNCCCFDVKLYKVRVTSLGGPLGLAEEGGLALELQIYATIDGVGSLYPSLSGHVVVPGKLVGPGPWVGAERLIKRVCLPKGPSKTFTVDFEVKENDKIFADDIGAGSVPVTVNCCFNDSNVVGHEVQLTKGAGKAVIGLQLKVEKVC